MSDQPSTRATVAGIVVVIVILALGIWVFSRLDASQRAQDCAERRGINCAIIDESKLPRR